MKQTLYISTELLRDLPSMIDSANSKIRLAIYQYSVRTDGQHAAMTALYRSMCSAPLRGVVCSAIICQGAPIVPSQDSSAKAASLLKAAGWLVTSIRDKKLMHVKGITIDDKIIVIGSHNWTKSGLLMNHEMSLGSSDQGAIRLFADWHDDLVKKQSQRSAA